MHIFLKKQIPSALTFPQNVPFTRRRCSSPPGKVFRPQVKQQQQPCSADAKGHTAATSSVAELLLRGPGRNLPGSLAKSVGGKEEAGDAPAAHKDALPQATALNPVVSSAMTLKTNLSQLP